MQDHPCTSDLEHTAHPGGAARSAAVDRLRSWFRQLRRDVAWAPLVARGVATAVALLGLAGIGLAASRSPELSELTRAPLSASLAQLAGPDLSAALGRGGAAATAALPSANAAAPSANATETPCPRGAEDEPHPESTEIAASSSERSAPTAGSRAKGSGLVILNRADAREFQRLPGVGAKRAAAIVELRKRVGRFRRPSDLLRVKGIGPKTLERMLPQLALDAPP